ncbi:MAG: HcpA family protein, partial [Devosia sp.]
MKSACVGVLALALLVTPALAAGSAPVPLPAPARENPGAAPDAPAAAGDATPAPAADAGQQPDAQAISAEVFGGGPGPRRQVDEAFGAYQRGAYLTALALALPRAEHN